MRFVGVVYTNEDFDDERGSVRIVDPSQPSGARAFPSARGPQPGVKELPPERKGMEGGRELGKDKGHGEGAHITVSVCIPMPPRCTECRGARSKQAIRRRRGTVFNFLSQSNKIESKASFKYTIQLWLFQSCPASLIRSSRLLLKAGAEGSAGIHPRRVGSSPRPRPGG